MTAGLDLRNAALPSAAVIDALGLLAHPEGGHYRETWRDPADQAEDAGGPRGFSTAILFLLASGEASHWHRVDADEIWLWQAGAPLQLSISCDGHAVAAFRLGPEVAAGQSPSQVVPRRQWQSAISLGSWSLVSCVVAPAFRFSGFELAAPDWQPR